MSRNVHKVIIFSSFFVLHYSFSFLISLFFILHSSFFILPFSFFILHSSFIIFFLVQSVDLMISGGGWIENAEYNISLDNSQVKTGNFDNISMAVNPYVYGTANVSWISFVLICFRIPFFHSALITESKILSLCP